MSLGPRRQSGQEFVCQMYKLMRRLRRNGNRIKFHWIPTIEDNKLTSENCNTGRCSSTRTRPSNETYRGNISFALGGKQPFDDQKWTPKLEAVRASICFAIATGRLEAT
ncbi:hypothetical protein N7494_000548 [Penicillium frequentans]|uniref:Uncharacterized protein n=1 Tax=Penicillium frequentans TaxID=3151616 RepID=A0AAD6D768_9EURO|nr:hypothetical protein N7494_000548 [Penicillium glabrum]